MKESSDEAKTAIFLFQENSHLNHTRGMDRIDKLPTVDYNIHNEARN